MNILGVIAEFNPLHTGHEYLIRKLRRETGAEFCVVVMSGDYVQRGEPAFFAKSLRTKAALLSGADLVLELPLSVATGSAEYFAEGAVALLDRLGCVTHLGFGSESSDIDAFQLAGKLLSVEPEPYRARLREHLKTGMSFPRARYEALSDSFEEYCLPGVLSLLASPNNILGAEYCKALYKLRSSMVPVTVKRLGAGYHEKLEDASAYASASGLRKAFLSSQNISFSSETVTSEADIALQNYVPASCRFLYAEALRAKQYAVFDQFFLPLYHILQYSDTETLSGYQDVTAAFAGRLLNLFGKCSSVTELCAALKAKNLTSAAINRALLHILLRLKKETVDVERKQGLALYARILGFRKETASLLSEIDKHTAVPIVSKLADASKTLSPLALSQLEQTLKASELYRAAMPGTKPESEYIQNIIIM